MLCCRPVLHLDYGWLQGWYELIVYPGEFRRPSRTTTNHRRRLEREAMRPASPGGAARWCCCGRTCSSVDAPEPGYDVVVHEIAHKLDGLHGGVDGAPRLHVDEVPGWARDFQGRLRCLVRELDAGREPPIDDYAGEAPAEFFAVCSEYWFTAPEILRAAYPAVAARLAAFYRNPQG